MAYCWLSFILKFVYCSVVSTFLRILKLPNAGLPVSRYIKKKILLYFLLWFGYFRNKQHLSGMKLEILCLFASISEMFPYICHSRSIEASEIQRITVAVILRQLILQVPLCPSTKTYLCSRPLQILRPCSCSGFYRLHPTMLLYHSSFLFLNALYN